MRSKRIDTCFLTLKQFFLCHANFRGFAVLLSAVLLFWLACGSAERTTDVVTTPEEAAEELPPGEGLDIGSIAPDFSLPDSDGVFQSLSRYSGQKTVLVFYRTST